jgi:uncharacterized protein YigE (DUF2233 family)
MTHEMKTVRTFAFIALALFWVRSLEAVEIRTVEHAGRRSIVCTVDPARERIELFLNDEKGAPLHNFNAVESLLRRSGRRLAFGMNGGMFHADYTPVGLFISDGREVTPLNLKPGEGNFFLKPNGVFAVTKDGAGEVMEASRFAAKTGTLRLATQSGPMLVIDGKLHPVFREGSDSRLFRNGVGIAGNGRVIFAISQEPVNFYEFATLFRDALGCRNALFLDGTISSLFAPELKRNDAPFPLGPILGVTVGKTAP